MEETEQVSTPLRPDNVISQKIMGVLSTSYTDSSIRMALLSLDERIDSNTVETRRDLRSKTEAEVIKSNGAILKDFSRLTTKLRSLGDTIDQLNMTYKSMDQLVNHAHRATSQIVRESADLRSQDDKILGKKVLLGAFQNTFVVTENEATALTSAAEPVDEAYFSALNKVKRIREDCQALMATETQETGVDIMTKMNNYLDKAYEKLFYSVQHDFKALSGQYMQIGKNLRQKLVVLAEKPSQFDAAMHELCETRQRNLSREFIKALTSEHDNSKPIDFYAYDALRYIGDIMAWIHSAAVNERENLDALFETDTMVSGLKQGQESEPWFANSNIKVVDTQVDKITSTLVKPLQQRVEQVLAAEPRATVIYQAWNILNFYTSTFEKHFPKESHVMVALVKLKEACMRQFNSRLEDKITVIKEQITQSEDLQPPDYLNEALMELKSCLTSYEASITYSPSGDNDIRKIIEDLVEPYLECCSRSASDMSDIDAQIFMINCYDSCKLTLSVYSFAAYKVSQLENRIQELADALEDRQVDAFIKSSGIRNHTDLKDPEVVRELSQSLDYFLPAATMESNQLLYRLNSPRLASTITLRASQRFADEFARIESELRQIYSDMAPDEFAMMFPRSLDEVRVLLAVD